MSSRFALILLKDDEDKLFAWGSLGDDVRCILHAFVHMYAVQRCEPIHIPTKTADDDVSDDINDGDDDDDRRKRSRDDDSTEKTKKTVLKPRKTDRKRLENDWKTADEHLKTAE